MNNGRMTFRFDVEQDKPNMEERWTGSTLNTTKDYDPVDQTSDVPQDPYNLYSNVQTTRPLYHPSDVYPEREKTSPLNPPLNVEMENEDSWYRSHSRPSEPFMNKNIYEDDPISDEIYSGAYHSRRPFIGWKFVASVAAAIGIGLLFGYGALSFFHTGDLPAVSINGGSNQTIADGQNKGTTTEPAGTGTSGLPITSTDSASGSSSPIPVEIAAQSYYLLQYGVFSNPEGASLAKQELVDAGLAAGVDPTEGNRVYAGISPDREQAKLLSNGLQSQGIDLYVREVAIPATAQLHFGGTTETVNHYFTVSAKILDKLSTLSASLLSKKATAVNEDVSSLHMEWTEAVKALESGSPQTALQLIAAQEKTLNQGISALNEYSKNKSDGLLWEVQASMMSFLTGQKELLSALN